MAVHKKRTTPSTQGQRRSHLALKSPSTADCANCGKAIKPHNACTHCGMYKGKKVLKV